MLIPLQNHKIIGEETSNKPELTDSPTWVIDPVDGTTNFVTGSPYVAVCIGFMVNKTIQCGVVYNPILDECFSARLGCGATLNDKKISVKKANKLKDSLILTGSSASRNQERADKIFGNMQEVVMNPCLGNFGQKLWSL